MYDCFVILKFKVIVFVLFNFFCKLKWFYLYFDKFILDLILCSCIFGLGFGFLGIRYLNKIFKKWYFEINNGLVFFYWELYNDIKINLLFWIN